MSKESYVDRVFLIFKLNEANNEVIVSERDKVHVLRICAVRKGIILEKWDDFKIYCQDKFTDLIYRNLNIERNNPFLNSATEFVEGIIREPYIS
jgi:hypothetical protein